jgi:hypothetical protein
VAGSSFVILVNGKDVQIPMKEKKVPMRVKPILRMADISADVGDLKGTRAYTPEHDPVALFTKNTAHEANLAAQQDFAGDVASQRYYQEAWKIQSTDHSFSATNPIQAGQGNPLQTSMERIALAERQNNLTLSTNAANKPMDNLGNSMGNDQFDAMEYTFELSSEKPLNNPYVVIVTRFQEKDAKPGFSGVHIFAQALDPIGPKAKKIDLLAGGLPPGFLPISYQIHFYNQGVEVASNVASDRVALTREEAFQYIKMEYISGNKGATLPAVPAMGDVPADLRERLSLGQYDRTYYVRVSKEGLARDAFLDEGCSQRAEDPYLMSIFREARFKPALKNGVPVEATVPLKLHQLMM